VLERTRRASAIALPGLTDDAIDQCERDYERAVRHTPHSPHKATIVA
jgi:hypothetical protein